MTAMIAYSPFFSLFIPVWKLFAADIDLDQIPQRLGDALGIETFPAGILATLILLMVFLIPIIIIARKNVTMAILIVGFSVLGFCTAVGWFPVYILAIISFIIALMFADKVTAKIGGKGGD